MDFLSNLTKKDDDKDKPTSDELKATSATHHTTKSDIMHSAKVVADAANAHARSEPNKYDKAEVAGAAAEYGKLDDKTGIGKYVDKAEDLLRHYSTDHAGKPTDHKPADAGKSADHKTADAGKSADHKPDDQKSEEHGGVGDFMKKAGDFLKK